MKCIRIIMALALFTGWAVLPASADEMSELKAMVESLQKDYESKIASLESKIRKLESKQSTQKAELEEVKSSGFNMEYTGRDHDSFGKGGLHIGHANTNSRVTLGGYIDHEFENFEKSNSTFDQHRWIINVGAEIGERLRFFSEYEIEHGGPDASGGGEAKVEQAWVDYLINDYINIRGGAVLVPFGRYNIYHDSDLNDLTDRPLVDRRVIPTTWTESGAGLHGEFNPTLGDYEDLLINYEVYVINGLNDSFDDRGFRSARGSLKSDNNNSKAVVGRVQLSPAIGHEFGFAGYWGAYDDAGDKDLTGFAFDWFSAWGPLEFIGEFAYFDADQVASGTLKPEELKGVYAQVNYHFWFDILDDTFLGREFEDPTFTLIGRYGWVENEDDGDAGTGDNEEERFTLGLNYRPVESWVIKTEWQWNTTENESLERGDKNGFMASVAMGF